MRRVVVTGMGGLSPIGNDPRAILENLRAGKSGLSLMPEWQEYDGLRTRLAGLVQEGDLPADVYSRKKTRGMGRVALLATRATDLALRDAGLLDDPEILSGAMGVAYGSSVGSTEAIVDFGALKIHKDIKKITSTTFIRMMSHTAAANIGLFFGIKGRVIPTSSACTSGSQGIGYAYESIKHGYQTMMVAGGAEEMCVTIAVIFDGLYATSSYNEEPIRAPRPFDSSRDGLVVSEGAGTIILEDFDHARARGARIHAEIVGYGCNSDGMHITSPNPETMRGAMELALQSAHLAPEAIGYINAHATGTELGDIAESQATQKLFGSKIPISSTKGAMGHTLGVSGALEALITVSCLQENWYPPTLNLNEIDPRCGHLDYIRFEGRRMEHEYAMSNNFAFGGINTSLIFKRID